MTQKQKIYLAGGFKSNWTEEVKKSSSSFLWVDPKEKEFKNGERVLMDVKEYGTWDLHHIKQADIVFVYVERTNGSCIGLSVEAGFAKGLGKTVITVLEKDHESIPDRYLNFIMLVSDITFNNLEDGISFLKSFDL